MIGVNVRVIDDVREKAGPQTDGLNDEVHEDGVLREIERTAEAHSPERCTSMQFKRQSAETSHMVKRRGVDRRVASYLRKFWGCYAPRKIYSDTIPNQT